MSPTAPPDPTDDQHVTATRAVAALMRGHGTSDQAAAATRAVAALMRARGTVDQDAAAAWARYQTLEAASRNLQDRQLDELARATATLERHRYATSLLDVATSHVEQLRTDLDALTADRTDLLDRIAAARDAVDPLEAATADAEAALAERRATIRTLTERRDTLADEIATLTRTHSTLTGTIEDHKQASRTIAAALDATEADADRLHADVADLTDKVADMRTAVEAARREAARAATTHRDLTDTLDRRTADLTDLPGRRDQLRHDLAATTAQLANIFPHTTVAPDPSSPPDTGIDGRGIPDVDAASEDDLDQHDDAAGSDPIDAGAMVDDTEMAEEPAGDPAPDGNRDPFSRADLLARLAGAPLELEATTPATPTESVAAAGDLMDWIRPADQPHTDDQAVIDPADPWAPADGPTSTPSAAHDDVDDDRPHDTPPAAAADITNDAGQSDDDAGTADRTVGPAFWADAFTATPEEDQDDSGPAPVAAYDALEDPFDPATLPGFLTPAWAAPNTAEDDDEIVDAEIVEDGELENGVAAADINTADHTVWDLPHDRTDQPTGTTTGQADNPWAAPASSPPADPVDYELSDDDSAAVDQLIDTIDPARPTAVVDALANLTIATPTATPPASPPPAAAAQPDVPQPGTAPTGPDLTPDQPTDPTSLALRYHLPEPLPSL